jgi:hypothetical protein
MPILTNSGRVVIAESIAARALHLAWGSGDGSWTVAPSENTNAVALQAEIGRRLVDEIAFVVADAGGNIVLPTGTFSRSVTPTNSLYVATRFDFVDAQSAVVRELGLFSNSTVIGGLPAGQRYFAPAQVQTQGRLLHLENIAPIFRAPSIRESFEIVITF